VYSEKLLIFVAKLLKMKQTFSSEALERFKEFRRAGFTRDEFYKLFSRAELIEILLHYVDKEEKLKDSNQQFLMSNIEKAEILYEKQR
jgi:hypothetical protein